MRTEIQTLATKKNPRKSYSTKRIGAKKRGKASRLSPSLQTKALRNRSIAELLYQRKSGIKKKIDQEGEAENS